MPYSLEETLRRPLSRTLWSRWQLDVINFILRRLFELSGDDNSTPIKVVRVTTLDMPRPNFSGTILWLGGYEEPFSMGDDDIHLAEI